MRLEALALIDEVGKGLKQATLDRGLPLSMGSSPSSTFAFQGPPLRCGLTLMGVDLDRLSKLVYDDLRPPAETILKTWEKACRMACMPGYRWFEDGTRQELADAFGAVFPSVPFQTRSVHDPRTVLGQFLAAVSLYTGSLKMGRSHVTLRLEDRIRLSVEHRAVEWHGGRRMLKNPIEDNLGAVATRDPPGGIVFAHHTTQTLYVHLLINFPQWSEQIRHVVSSAVYLDREGGRQAQDFLVDYFDVYSVDDVPPVPRAFQVAKSIVKSARRNPRQQVIATLSPLLGFETVEKVIGPSQGGYSRKVRDDLLRGVEKLKNDYLIDKGQDIHELMQLQEMIRG